MAKYYKGFNEDLTCRGFQYEEGKTYEEPTAELCNRGFHACEDPLDCFSYYSPRSSQFREVLLEGVADTHKDDKADDTKVCAQKITVGARLSLSQMIRASFDFRWPRATLEPEASATGDNGAASATGDNGAASATGYNGAASATGNYGAASATGNYGAASATGNYGAASATGYNGAASATGYKGAASATGNYGIAAALGKSGKAKGALGCWLILAEHGDRDDKDDKGYPIKNIKAYEVDGVTILADTWYTLKNGKPEKTE